MAKQKKVTKAKSRASQSARKPKKAAPPRSRIKRGASHRKDSKAKSVRGRQPEKRLSKAVMVTERNPQAVKLYEAALKSFAQQEFARARETFQRVIEGFPQEAEIVERSRVHLNICQQRLSRNAGGLKSAEDHYNMAIAHLNRRELDEAEKELTKALDLEPKSDHIIYALATLESMRGNAPQALKYLQKAIQLNPLNKAAALHDADLEKVAQTPEFQELVRTTVRGA